MASTRMKNHSHTFKETISSKVSSCHRNFHTIYYDTSGNVHVSGIW